MSVILLWVTENIQTPLSEHLLPFSILAIKCFLGNGTIRNLLSTEMKFSPHSYFAGLTITTASSLFYLLQYLLPAQLLVSLPYSLQGKRELEGQSSLAVLLLISCSLIPQL